MSTLIRRKKTELSENALRDGRTWIWGPFVFVWTAGKYFLQMWKGSLSETMPSWKSRDFPDRIFLKHKFTLTSDCCDFTNSFGSVDVKHLNRLRVKPPFLKFPRRSVDGKHLNRLRVNPPFLKFPRRSVDGKHLNRLRVKPPFFRNSSGVLWRGVETASQTVFSFKLLSSR